MAYLIKKMLRDMKQDFTQFIAVFLMAAISVMIFSGMASVWTGLNNVVSEEVENTNMADYYIKAMQIKDEDKEKILNLKMVDQISLNAKNSFSTSDGESEIEVNLVENYDVSNITVISGEKIDADKTGIYLDSNYAQKHHLKSGDKIKLDGMVKKDIEVEILGTIHSPEYIYYTGAVTETVPNYEKYGYGFVNEETYLKLCPQINYTIAKIKGSQEPGYKEIENILGNRLICVQDREDYGSYSRANKESAQMQKMATLFSIVFIVLSLLTMYTSMVRLVGRQTQLIGTMKGLGIKSKQILIHYALYGIFVPLLGGVTGLIVGRFTVSRALMQVKQTTLYLTEWKLSNSPLSAALIGLIVLCCVLASVLATVRVLRGRPAEIMRGNVDAKKSNLKEGPLSKKLSYTGKIAMRNMMENKVRFIMGIIGVFGGMVLIIAGFGVKEAIRNSNDFVFSKQFTYEIKGVLQTPGEELPENEEVEYLYETNVELKCKERVKQTILTALERGENYHFYNAKNQEISLPEKGMFVSRQLASDLGIKKGDIVKVRVFGRNEWKKVEVKELSKTLSPQGIFFSKGALEGTGTDFVATGFVAKGRTKEHFMQKKAVKNVITRQEQLENTEIVADSVMSVVKLLIIASILLSVVILYNLGILNYVERVREYATMKVLGFYQKEIQAIAIFECLITTGVGFIMGIPLGSLFLKVYVKTISFETFEWVATVSAKTYAIASIVIVGVSLGVNFILAAKVKKLVMVEALKSVE